ncbi:MAG: serine/threonine protein kinase [Spirochaetes bacterium]|nr:serine/threonine protein kinase [Spirochaetota bacterium]
MKTKVGKYAITGRIARGGMGEILKARHPTLNKDVILKRLAFSAKGAVIERFKREAQLQIDFRNDNIVQVYDHFKEGLSYYIVMEYVDGISLDALIEKHRYLPDEIALLIFYQIAQALKYAHDKDVIHRDIKPANVLISKEGIVKLTDFGIATSKEFHDKYLTREMTLGTPAYMSPEQITDTKSVDRRADIYSMGVVLYEMVTGKCPFPCDISSENIHRIQKGKYIRPSKVNPKVSPLAGRIIKKAMHHRIKRRYSDLDEILAILSARLRKYRSQEMMSEAIRLFVQGKTGDVKKIKPKGKPAPARGMARTAAAVVAFAALAAVSGFYAYKKGYHHEFYRADEFGALRAEIRLDASGGNPEAHYIRSTLMARGPRGYAPLPEGFPEFRRTGTGTENPGAVYATPRAYLPAGSYRLMVDVDNTIYQRDFFLMPRAAQKTAKENGGIQVVSINHSPISAMPVTITYEVRDARSGSILTPDVDCFVFCYNRWVKWQDLIGGPESGDFLVSGKKYLFSFNKSNYFNRTVSIDVLPHQARVDFLAEMVPVPGVLLIMSKEPGVEILINNNPYYIEGGSNARIVRLDPLTTEARRIVLSPDTYYLTARTEGFMGTEPIVISPKKYTRVIVKVDRGNNLIVFTVY